ncbi:MAG TPA: RNA 2'-phosphotransferase [Abditibacteriaceae bacterium]|jgi:putative RNA 2'-phosphotransferase
MNSRLVSASKFLSLILRHQPQIIGLSLDAHGWADVEDLLARANANGKRLSRAIIEEVVAKNEKKRFALSDDGQRIRANQGHSVQVDVELEAVTPPEILYHGTATRFLASIQAQGLMRGNRLHVHLSADEATAINVGKRHGKPVVLRVRAGAMHKLGRAFYLSANGVWLCAEVPPEFLEFP